MSTETISGRVTQVNETGIKVEGRDQYLNYSKYGDAANVQRAALGEYVVVVVEPNKKGSLFIQSLSKNGHDQDAGVRRSVYSEADFHLEDRSLSIVRQVCLKAAVEFYSMITDKAEVREGKPTDVVLSIATKFESWVVRKDVER